MTNFIQEFLDALTAAGFHTGKKPIYEDNKIHRCYFGDEKRSSATYSLKIDGDFAYGWFKSFKDGKTHNWHSKSGQKLSKEERLEIARKYREEKKIREEHEAARKARLSHLLTKAYKNLKPAPENHPYLQKKQAQPHGIKYRKKGGELIIPLYNAENKVGAVQRITKTGWKGFHKGGGAGEGKYFPIAKSGDDKSALIICEGFATGASVYEATGIPVIVAFNTGNLKSVGKRIREKYPEAKIIFAADNDAFTFKNGKKPEGADDRAGDDPIWQKYAEADLLENPGIEKAKEAAVEIGGHVVYPVFEDTKNKPTDFNDLACAEGHEPVKNIISAAIIEKEEIRVESGGAVSYLDEVPPHDENLAVYSHDENAGGVSTFSFNEQGDLGHNFKVLGYNEKYYYYFPFQSRQIVRLTAKEHDIKNLITLDDYENWTDRYGGSGKDKVSDSMVATYAFNALHKVAIKKGVFIEENIVRGCGAWLDNGRVVLHAGDRLYINGKETGLEAIGSKYTYIASARLLNLHSDPIANRDAIKLRQICEKITWENSLSGILMSGWLVIAPLCGALEYRPHIWLTGEAESGKSTVIDKIIKPVLGDISLNFDGGTTEPAIRNSMGYSARPLVYDEAEAESSRETMKAVVELMRKASTGSTVKKYGQDPFVARFAACMSGINPPVNKTADESRISFLVIKKNTSRTAIQDYDELLTMIEDTITPEFSRRLFARTIRHVDVLMENIKIFQRAARRVIGGARASQQIGTMLAGAYMLSSSSVVDEAQAQEWIEKYEWTDHTSVNDVTDPGRLVQHIMSYLVRWQKTDGITKDISIGDLVLEAENGHNQDTARTCLKNYGMIVKDGMVYIANTNPNMAKILRDTDWNARWSRSLGDIEGAVKTNPMYFGPGPNIKATGIPLDIIKDKGRAKPVIESDFAENVEEIPF